MSFDKLSAAGNPLDSLTAEQRVQAEKIINSPKMTRASSQVADILSSAADAASPPFVIILETSLSLSAKGNTFIASGGKEIEGLQIRANIANSIYTANATLPAINALIDEPAVRRIELSRQGQMTASLSNKPLSP